MFVSRKEVSKTGIEQFLKRNFDFSNAVIEIKKDIYKQSDCVKAVVTKKLNNGAIHKDLFVFYDFGFDGLCSKRLSEDWMMYMYSIFGEEYKIAYMDYCSELFDNIMVKQILPVAC